MLEVIHLAQREEPLKLECFSRTQGVSLSCGVVYISSLCPFCFGVVAGPQEVVEKYPGGVSLLPCLPVSAFARGAWPSSPCRNLASEQPWHWWGRACVCPRVVCPRVVLSSRGPMQHLRGPYVRRPALGLLRWIFSCRVTPSVPVRAPAAGQSSPAWWHLSSSPRSLRGLLPSLGLS